MAKRAAGRNGNPEDVTILRGTEGNDKISISQGQDGGLKVTINDDVHEFTEEEAKKLVIDGGDGNDTIKADKTVTTGLFITGGAGNDRIIGGSGNDYIIDNYDRMSRNALRAAIESMPEEQRLQYLHKEF